MAVKVIALLSFWLITGWVGAARTFAHFQREFKNRAAEHYRDDLQFAFLVSTTGPIGMIVSLLSGGHGFNWFFRKEFPHGR